MGDISLSLELECLDMIKRDVLRGNTFFFQFVQKPNNKKLGDILNDVD